MSFFLVILYDILTVTSRTYVVSTLNPLQVLPLSFYLANVLVGLIPALGSILMILEVYRIGYSETNVRVGRDSNNCGFHFIYYRGTCWDMAI